MMPRLTDISSILIIGAGPIVIGQAREVNYSRTQACKALREETCGIVHKSLANTVKNTLSIIVRLTRLPGGTIRAPQLYCAP